MALHFHRQIISATVALPDGSGGLVEVKTLKLEYASRKIVDQDLMIGLASLIAEGMFFDGKAPWRDVYDDVEQVEALATDLLKRPDACKWVNDLPQNPPGPLDMIKDPVVRSYLEHLLDGCALALIPRKVTIEAIALALVEKNSLSPNELNAIFKRMSKG